MRIEDLALIGDSQTIALVGRDGGIHWLCMPRFDSGACFASLLGGPEHGHWTIRPPAAAHVRRVERRYRTDSLVLETDFHTQTGIIRLVDAMPIRGRAPDIVRLVIGISGTVDLRAELALRFDYGRSVPWMRTSDGRLSGVSGPNAVVIAMPASILRSARTHGEEENRGGSFTANFRISKSDEVPFVLTWYPSHEKAPESPDAATSIEATERFWREWSSRLRSSFFSSSSSPSPYRDAVIRSLITIKALTFAPTGGIVAAGTTSLPEAVGGERNWDYRYCWLRDAAFALYAMLHAGYHEEAIAWRDWLLRAVAGDPSSLQIMYGVAGERYLGERTLDWLPGYERSQPVRVGNAAAGQLQLDVYGEVLDTFHQALANWLESNWRQPDEGLWEVRNGRRQFTFSKVMAWVAMDRAIKAVTQHGREGPPAVVDRWRRARGEIHDQVCRHGFDATLGSFTQSYGEKTLDASLLLIPSTGFLSPEDPPRAWDHSRH